MSREFNYELEIEVGPSYYSEQTDEDFCATDTVPYTYSVCHSDIVKAFIHMYTDSQDTAKEKAKKVIKELLSEEDMKELFSNKTLDETLDASIGVEAEDILEDIIDVEDYIDDQKDSDLKYYFEEAAYEDYSRNK